MRTSPPELRGRREVRAELGILTNENTRREDGRGASQRRAILGQLHQPRDSRSPIPRALEFCARNDARKMPTLPVFTARTQAYSRPRRRQEPMGPDL